MEIRKGRHVVYAMHCHLVFVTKYRRKVFDNDHLQFLEDVFRKICSDFEVELEEFNGEGDHVHLLVTYPPKVNIAKLVNSLKGVSSRRLAKKYGRLHRFFLQGRLMVSLLFCRKRWRCSYFCFEAIY